MTALHHLPRPVDYVPSAVLRRVADRPSFLDGIARYVTMSDDDLLRATEVCLNNLTPLDDNVASPDSDLQLILVPEIWERIRPGQRDKLRRISSTMAEYKPDLKRPSIFAQLLSSEAMANLRTDADDLRARVAVARRLDIRALVERVRFAIAGSRASVRWPPDTCVYETGFVYRLVPALAWRGLDRAARINGQ